MFSKTVEYALRAVFFVAQKSEDGRRIGIKEISKGINAPEHFLAKILQDLSRKGLIQSIKGPNGGFYIEETARTKNVAEIVKAIDGDKLFTGCGLGLKVCSEKNPCPLHDKFKVIREQISEMLESVTITEFNIELVKGTRYLKR